MVELYAFSDSRGIEGYRDLDGYSATYNSITTDVYVDD